MSGETPRARAGAGAGLDPAAIERVVHGALAPPGGGTWALILCLAAGVALGAGCFAYQVGRGFEVTGKNNPVGWGAYITSFVFWIGIAHSGTLLSAILYFARARFRVPLARAAEAMTVLALAVAGLFPLIHLGQPGLFYTVMPLPNRRELWPNFNSPLTWDVLAITTYLFVSTAFLWLGLVPDLAALRDGTSGLRRKLYTLGALGFRGASAEYASLRRAYRPLAGIAAALVLVVSSVVSFDFAMSLEPGWHSTLFPPYFVAGAIHSGLGLVLVLIVPMRRWLRLEPLITLDHLDKLAQLLLLTTVLVAYIYLVEPFTAWLSGDVFERAIMQYRAGGPYAPAYWFMIVANVAAPATLLRRSARRNPRWLLAVGLLVVVGMWLERFIIVVTTTAHDFVPASWGSYLPSRIELGIAAGALCLFTLLFLLFIRHLPPVATAEIKAEEWRRGGGGFLPALAAGGAASGSRRGARSAERRFVLGVFASAGAAARAARDLAGAGYAEIELLAPFDVPAFRRPEPPRAGLALHAAALLSGCTGAGLGLVGPALAAAAFDRRVGSKPAFPVPSYLVISCEMALLFAAVAVLGVCAIDLVRSGRRLRRAPAHDRLTRDRYGVLLATAPGEADHVRMLLAAAGAEEVRA